MRGVYIGCDWLALSGRADLAWCFLAFLLFLGSGGFGFVSPEWALVMAFGVC